MHGYSFGAAENGVSFGRYVTSLGEEHFVSSDTDPEYEQLRSEGWAGGDPEIMYHPPDLAGGEDNQDDEFVELRNVTASNVALFSAAFPTNRWHLRGGIDYDFPSNTTFAAGGRLLAVSFDDDQRGQAGGLPPTLRSLGQCAGLRSLRGQAG